MSPLCIPLYAKERSKSQYTNFMNCGRSLKILYAGKSLRGVPIGKTMSLHKLCSRQREYYRVDAFPNLGVEARLPL